MRREGDGALVEKGKDEGVGMGGLGMPRQLCPLDVLQIRHFVHLDTEPLVICHAHTSVNRWVSGHTLEHTQV